MLLYTVNQVRFTHIGDASERQPLISSLRFWKETGISVTNSTASNTFSAKNVYLRQCMDIADYRI